MEGEGALRLSRTAALRTLGAGLALGYCAAALLLIRAVEPLGATAHWAVRVVVVFGATFAAMLLMPPGRARSWVKIQLAKHLFRHRYDYRTEWLRFTRTLGSGAGEEELTTRIERALADLTVSPEARLFVPASGGRLEPAAGGGWPAAAALGFDESFARAACADPRILNGDALRAPEAGPAATEEERRVAPAWLLADLSVWAGVPLIHGERLAGYVLLARPPVDRPLDWEDHDLLAVAGRQVASHLAEAQGQAHLAEARRFHEFNRRFAFIVHDVKNLASQLGLVARNAERHADNPAFRADMIVTLNECVGRLDGLLARLSPQQAGRADPPRAADPMDVLHAIALRRRSQHRVVLEGQAGLSALCDPGRLETALMHLVQNAIEASPGGEPVRLAVAARAAEVVVTVSDRGRGMTADFIRHQLFKPFESSKAGGFGIGAYEARALIASMGGRLEVESVAGEGSRFTILLPAAAPARLRA